MTVLDVILIMCAVLFFTDLVLHMIKAPGEAGFGIILIPIPFTIIGYSLFSILLNSLIIKRS